MTALLPYSLPFVGAGVLLLGFSLWQGRRRGEYNFLSLGLSAGMALGALAYLGLGLLFGEDALVACLAGGMFLGALVGSLIPKE